MATGLIYFQHLLGLNPCALCITQRVFICAVGLVALLAFIVNPNKTGRRIFAAVGVLLAVGGSYFSGRQVWLQNLPEDQGPACGPTFEYLLQNFPLMDALRVMLRGDGNCAEVVWQFLGLSIPAWTLVAFAGLAAFNIWQFVRKS